MACCVPETARRSLEHNTVPATADTDQWAPGAHWATFGIMHANVTICKHDSRAAGLMGAGITPCHQKPPSQGRSGQIQALFFRRRARCHSVTEPSPPSHPRQSRQATDAYIALCHNILSSNTLLHSNLRKHPPHVTNPTRKAMSRAPLMSEQRNNTRMSPPVFCLTRPCKEVRL